MDTINTRENKIIYRVSAMIAVFIALWGILAHRSFSIVADGLMAGLLNNFPWLYLWVMLLFVLFCFALVITPWGSVKLGKDSEKPEYSAISWFAMLFCAGMGIGLVFWGIAEPLAHYVTPMNGIEPASMESAHFSMRSVFMHWGFHPWACYAVIGLGLAYFGFRKDTPAMVSNLLTPIVGTGKFGKGFGIAVDIYTAVLTAVGVATSFGMGCLQISGGLNELFGVPNTVWVWIVLITVICICYLTSAITGVEKGIKFLSNFNLILFMALMVLSYLIGDTLASFKMGAIGVVDYLKNFFADSVRLQSEGDSTWIQNWRVFYWAWWLSWAPFVGSFIARISRGRTIREFVAGVIIVPTIVSIFWFGACGGLSLQAAADMPPELIAEIAAVPETALFRILAKFPMGAAVSIVAIVLLVTFFITSADSATFVLSMMTSGGELNPPTSRKLFWGILIAVLALALIMSGGIAMIQKIAIIIAFPYLFILIMIGVSVVKSLIHEKKTP